MIRDITDDHVVLQSGYWRVEADTARPRVTSLRADPAGLGRYCQEMLEPGWGGESVLEMEGEVLRSRDSTGHAVEAEETRRLHVRGIRMGDAALVDWTLELAGDGGSVLRITIARTILREAAAVTDLVFGFHCPREFAFWSRPSLRFHHDPAAGAVEGYRPLAERMKRRVIGYHGAEEMPEFVIHGSPSYPDITQRISGGFHHLEQHYAMHAKFGVSALDFSDGPQMLRPGESRWTVEWSVSPQGALAPVDFRSGNARADAFVPGFFDGYLLSSVACDHEYFGNNPYRHAYAPGAADHLARGFLTTDRRSWSPKQGDIEERWRLHIRRTLKEGTRPDGRLRVLLDSGVWQDACGSITGKAGAWSHESLFVNGCCLALLKSGDLAFGREIFGFLETRMRMLAELDTDGDGLLENPIPGTPGSPASCYNDNLGIGHKDGALNSTAYEAFRRMASLARALGREELARDYREKADRLADAYNRQLWNEEGGRYLGWVDIEGKPHDAWYTLINFPAVTSGLVPPDRARRMMESFLAHPNHHRIFAAGVNLDPIPASDISHSCSQFGLWLNGGALLGPAAHELYARAVGRGGECAWEMLDGLIAQWEKDRLCGTPLFDWCRSDWRTKVPPRLVYTGKNAYTWIDGLGATGAGTEPYLADGGAILWALYEGVFGLRADFQGLSLQPHVPKALKDASLAVRLMGRRIELRYHGFGDRLEGIAVNGAGRRAEDSLPWTALPEGSVLDVRVVRK